MLKTSIENEQAVQLFEMYKIILADEWDEMSEKERRNHIRRMMFAVYGAYDEREALNLISEVRDTDIYKWAERQGIIDESNVDRQRPEDSGSQSSNSLYEANLGSRAMSLLRAAYQRIGRAVPIR